MVADPILEKSRAAPSEPLLYSTMATTDTPGLIAQMLQVFFPDVRTVLDSTYGNGRFWDARSRVAVTRLDRDPERARDVCGDFTALPFVDGAFDLVVFDPPFHTDMGHGKPSVMGSRFGTYATIPELRRAVERGCAEAWRVARLGILIKCQDYIHSSRVQWMDDWVKEILGLPYERVIQTRPNKVIDPKWGDQLSAYRNHAVFLAYRKDGDLHRRRR